MADAAPYPALRATLWPVSLLFFAAILYNVDRLVVGVLAEPIRTELRISDFQMSLLLGLAFNLLSSSAGLVVGYLVDRSVRRTVLGLGLLLWSGATIAGGFAPDFRTFFMCRALVGLGEAALAPAALSLIADLFGIARRGRALSGFYLGATCGSSLAAFIPGAVALGGIHFPLPHGGTLTTWRTTLIICGLLGPIVGLLFFSVREPLRRGVGLAVEQGSGVAARLHYLWRQRRVIAPLVGGGVFFFIALSASTSWTATFLMRAYHLSLAELAAPLGIMNFVAGFAGYLLAGFLVDSDVVRRHGGKSTLLVLVPFVALPATLAVFCPGPRLALLALSAITLATPLHNVAANGSIQDLLPNAMRGFSLTLFGAVGGLLSFTTGPLLVALATERLFGRAELIGYSLTAVGLPSLLGAAVCFAWSRRALRTALASDGELARVVAASH